MQSSSNPSLRYDVRGSWLLILIGLIHSGLTLGAARHAPLLWTAGALMVVVGVANLASVHALSSQTTARVARGLALCGSFAGIMLAIELLWTDPFVPQGLSLLMVFTIAALFLLTRSPW